MSVHWEWISRLWKIVENGNEILLNLPGPLLFSIQSISENQVMVCIYTSY